MLMVGIALILIGAVITYFKIPISVTKTEFLNLASDLSKFAESETSVFTEANIARLPAPVKKYFRYCGFVGKPQMSYAILNHHDVDFVLNRDDPMLKIEYTQYNFVKHPDRLAYIDSSMYGIPFEGLDAYVDGTGFMKGVLAKHITLFNQTGRAMNESSLVTYLSECLIVPSVALQDYVVWEEIDSLHARAVMTWQGITVDGIFTFSTQGEMLSFETDCRTNDETNEKVRWTIMCNDYKDENGIKTPHFMQAIWNFDDSDLVYFAAKDTVIEYL
jgi:hypothetical protein